MRAPTEPCSDRREPVQEIFPLYEPVEARGPLLRTVQPSASGEPLSAVSAGAALRNPLPPGGAESRALDPLRCGTIVLGVLAVVAAVILPVAGLPWYARGSFYFTLFGVAICLRLLGSFTQARARVSVTDGLIVREGVGGWSIARADVARVAVEQRLGRPYLLVAPRQSPRPLRRVDVLGGERGWPSNTYCAPLDPARVAAIQAQLDAAASGEPR